MAPNKQFTYISLLIWIIAILFIGTSIGAFTKTEINTWYTLLNRSALTPANYIFPIAWTILYVMIASSGWLIWRSPHFSNLNWIKGLYIFQLLLNWSWTPLFFIGHFIGLSFAVLLIIDIMVALIIYLTSPRMKTVSMMMLPYFLWLLFATYLNFYIFQHN